MRSCGVDVGGTFTDLVYLDSSTGEVVVKKVPSTPLDQTIGVKLGIETLQNQVFGFQLDVLVHGSTVATNAILERKVAKTAFITTEGFKDIIEIGRQNRTDIYNLLPSRPAPLVPRELRFGIKERIATNGDVLTPFELQDLDSIIEILEKERVEAVAVSFLFSFFNDVHERFVGEQLISKLPGTHVSLSSEVLPEFREYERSITTVLDACIAPRMINYFNSFAIVAQEKGITASPLILLSNGGVTHIETASQKSVETILSGLAGGVLGGLATTSELGITNAITLDIGGTSTDVACIKDGKNEITRDNAIGDFPLRIASMDVQSTGAGGGSIAKFKHGKIEVGPESAGADPGPACYGLGGKHPTVTDAYLIMEMLDESNFCGGTVPINPDLAKHSIGNLAKETGFETIEECAAGIIEIFETNVNLALRKVSTERGHDPRDFSLIAFGGAGPLSACSLVDKLNMKEVIIPPYPGAWSAFGLLTSDIRHDLSRSYLKLFSELTDDLVERIFDELARTGISLCEADGFTSKDVTISRKIDVRLQGQSYELPIPYDGDLEVASREFDRLHEQMYGYSIPKEPRVLVNLRLSAIVELPSFLRVPLSKGSPNPSRALKGNRKIFLQGEWVEKVPIYRREQLLAGNIITGPAIIEQADSTTLVDQGWVATVEKNSHIVIRRE
ncbi:MAG: hydantoinase/oxoprolinase family protein [Candidatus Hodarchaeales archaeon]|jgi:N-methylhydantoinase A